jgi:hypothetical protein
VAGPPVSLIINGRAEFVVEDATSYQKLLELVERLETMGAVREGLASADRGEGRLAEEFFEELGQGRKGRPEA